MRLYLEPDRLRRLAQQHHARYEAAEPFPHAVLDGVLPEEALDLALEAFPDPESRVWREYENYHEKKLETQGEERLGSTISLLLYHNSLIPRLFSSPHM